MKELPIYDKQTIEFVTVGAEYCAFIEMASSLGKQEFVDKSLKLLPLLYLKAQMLPQTDFEYDDSTEKFVTEEHYQYICATISHLLASQDDYLEVFTDDIQYSESPVKASISEDLADIYQDIKDFISVYSLGFEATMNDALATLNENFREYWGQKLVNVMRPLHSIKFGEPVDEEEENYQENQNNNSSDWLRFSQKDSEFDDDEFDKWNE